MTDPSPPDEQRSAEVDAIVEAAADAAREFRKLSQEQVDRIVEAMVRAGLRAAADLAAVAIEETGFGVFEDKVVKNYVATEFLHDYLRGKKSVGVIDEDVENNISYVAEPIGVVLAITPPVTNPTSTVLFKAIVAAKTRNAVLFRPSPYAVRCCERSVEILREAAEAAGMPRGGAAGHPGCRARGHPPPVQASEGGLRLGHRRPEDRRAGQRVRQARRERRTRKRPDLHPRDRGRQGRRRRHSDLEKNL